MTGKTPRSWKGPHKKLGIWLNWYSIHPVYIWTGVSSLVLHKIGYAAQLVIPGHLKKKQGNQNSKISFWYKFKANLVYIRPCLKTKPKKKKPSRMGIWTWKMACALSKQIMDADLITFKLDRTIWWRRVYYDYHWPENLLRMYLFQPKLSTKESYYVFITCLLLC